MFFAKSGSSDVFIPLPCPYVPLKVADLKVVTSFWFISSARRHERTRKIKSGTCEI